MKVRFLGATQQVTGSCILIETDGLRLLVDCGLFQERAYLSRNWEAFPVAPETIDALFLTHVHVDHSGLIPKLVREGFSGPVYTTRPSKALLPIVLLDAARMQEEDAAYKKKRHRKEGRKGPHPEVPLYTVEETERVFPHVKEVLYRKDIQVDSSVSARFHEAGHILGSAILEIDIQENGRKRILVFSGDLGPWNRPLMRDPAVFDRADYVIMESTYGDRDHEDPQDIEDMLAEIITQTFSRAGNVIIPTFAIERAQELLFYLGRLARENRVPYGPVFLDSPMAIDITDVFLAHQEYMDGDVLELIHSGKKPFHVPGLKFTRTTAESKAINAVRQSSIIMAGSGMCTGGRIKHHLVQNITRPESTILFVGYQARGTLGRLILDGAHEVRILGQTYPVQAQVAQINGFSAHAGQKDLLRWVDAFRTPPERLFLVHGEKEVATSLARKVRNKKWEVALPDYQEEWDLP